MKKAKSVEGAAMIKGLSWLGTRTDHYSELITFYRKTMGLEVDHEEEDFIAFKLPDGSKVEVFGPSDREHLHFETGPVAGFEVDDIETACEPLEAGGADFIGPVYGWAPTGEAWSHFRARMATSMSSLRQAHDNRGDFAHLARP